MLELENTIRSSTLWHRSMLEGWPRVGYQTCSSSVTPKSASQTYGSGISSLGSSFSTCLFSSSFSISRSSSSGSDGGGGGASLCGGTSHQGVSLSFFELGSSTSSSAPSSSSAACRRSLLVVPRISRNSCAAFDLVPFSWAYKTKTALLDSSRRCDLALSPRVWCFPLPFVFLWLRLQAQLCHCPLFPVPDAQTLCYHATFYSYSAFPA